MHYIWDSSGVTSEGEDGHTHPYNRNDPWTGLGGSDNHIHPIGHTDDEDIEIDYPAPIMTKAYKRARKKK
jgi:hypothetical protein